MIGAGRNKEVEGHVGDGELRLEGKWGPVYLASGKEGLGWGFVRDVGVRGHRCKLIGAYLTNRGIVALRGSEVVWMVI